jgi:hypothetical protein
MLGLAALTAMPGGTLVLRGTARHQPALQSAGVLAGIATGALLYRWGGSVASRRLADQGAELMDLLRVGPQAAAGAKPVREPEVRLPPAAAAAREPSPSPAGTPGSRSQAGFGRGGVLV